MKPWFKVVIPHSDIREGKLDESVFAANLAEVASGAGPEVYSNANSFFAKTYFTAGIKTICKRVVDGLDGNHNSGDRILSLQTGFGGGKTHSLITLYHIAKNGSKVNQLSGAKDLTDGLGNINFDTASVAVFTNTTCDPTQGRKVDGLTIRTIWGELAYQLGGKPAYELIRENDEARSCPKGVFSKVLEKCKPALILIDELADYCVSAASVKVEQSTLADQTISFVQELTESIRAVPGTVLVATLPASVDEVASSELGTHILNTLSNRLSRMSADTKPVSDDEIFEVIRRRLFDTVGTTEEIEKVVSSYMNLYQSLKKELPSYANKTEYKEKLRKSYPFHPELIEMFHIRWAANHDFQRTRGVLKLLGSIVNDLYKRQNTLPGDHSMIHTSDVNFANLDALSSQLKKLYGNGYDAVISADISGSSANAFRIDTEVKEYGDYNLTQGIAATILLGSFGSLGSNKGIGLDELKLCVMRPDSFNHNSIHGSLDKLENVGHYLYYSVTGSPVKRYWFNTKPNINILINQAKNDFGRKDFDTEIIRRLNLKKSFVSKFDVLVAPESDIPEITKPTIFILHPKFQANGGDRNGNAGEIIAQLAQKRGNSERIHRNTILFLVCSEMGYSRLQTDISDFLACQAIKEQYQGQLEPEQRSDILKKIEGYNQSIDKSLAAAYSLVFKNRAKDGIERLDIRQFKDSIDNQINVSIYDALKNEEWLIEAVGMGLLRKNNLVPSLESPVKVKDIYEAFLRFDDKPIIANRAAVENSLLKYCFEGEYAIASGTPGSFTKIYYQEKVPYFDLTDDNYWLVDKSHFQQPVPIGGSQSPDEISRSGQSRSGPGPSTLQFPPAGTPTGQQAGAAPIDAGQKIIKSIKVSGKVDVSNYSQVFTSFITPLTMNDVEIYIEIRAHTKTSNPITENSTNYKIPKESAKQLGLKFEEE